LSIQLYPSLCFFEGTNVSVGRGTEAPFQIIGSPFLKGDFWDTSFTPMPNPVAAPHPPHEGKLCYGYSFLSMDTLGFRMDSLNLDWLIMAYESSENKPVFFNDFMKKLAGSNQLEKQIKAGKTQVEIRETWQEGLEKYSLIRKKYLLYEE